MAAEGEGVSESASFKEETNVVAELEDPEKKALDELKALIQAALANNEFSPPPPPPAAPAASTDVSPATPAAAAEEPSPAAATEEPAAATLAAATEKPVSSPATTEDPAAAAPAPTEEAKPETEEAKTEVAAEIEEAQKTKDPVPPVEDAPVDIPLAPVLVAEEDEGAKTVKAIEETAVPLAPAETETPATSEPEAPAPAPEVFIWGLPLLGDEKSDTVLLKFLRARDFKVKDALAMIKNAVIWRKQFGIEALVEEDLEVPELEKVVYNHGFDKEGHPVCYNVYGEFQNKELYSKVFGDEEKREKFLRWRIQYLEKGIRQQLDFSPGAISTMVQVNDFKNLPGPGKKELRLATKKALALLQDNYPEFVAKQIHSAPEQVPVLYGGLSKETDPDFSTADAITEVVIKPASKHTVDIPATEGDNLVWELRVLGWEVSYNAEFVPSADESYTVIVQKARKFSPADEPYVKNSFKIGEAGKVVLTIDNATSKKKKLLYRSKANVVK